MRQDSLESVVQDFVAGSYKTPELSIGSYKILIILLESLCRTPSETLYRTVYIPVQLHPKLLLGLMHSKKPHHIASPTHGIL